MTTYVILHNMIIKDEDLNLKFFFGRFVKTCIRMLLLVAINIMHLLRRLVKCLCRFNVVVAYAYGVVEIMNVIMVSLLVGD
jgi:hypothetical protein